MEVQEKRLPDELRACLQLRILRKWGHAALPAQTGLVLEYGRHETTTSHNRTGVLDGGSNHRVPDAARRTFESIQQSGWDGGPRLSMADSQAADSANHQ